MKPASALLFIRVDDKGQQIQCESGADGHSPDGRESLYLHTCTFGCNIVLHIEWLNSYKLLYLFISRIPKTALVLVT